LVNNQFRATLFLPICFNLIYFFSCIKLNPKWYLSYFRRGVANCRESEEEQALKDIKKVNLQFNPIYRTSFSICYLLQSLNLNPPPLDFHLIRCMQDQMEGNFKGAVDQATIVINQEPNNAYAWYLRGYNRFDLNDFLGAIEDLTHALRLANFLNCWNLICLQYSLRL
jgi:tetratricopeptide (TPR) repeat protein